MLIESKSISKDDIVSIKLNNGDELIAKFVEERKDANTEYFVVSKPVLVVLGQHPTTGQPAVQMVPFFMISADKDSKFPLNKAQIVCAIKSADDAKKGYFEATTGLAMPKATGASLVQP